MTALTTSPRFTPAAGIASLTVATMTSPIPAYRRPEPPSTRMQRISFAPVLSATRSRDSCWITSYSQILVVTAGPDRGTGCPVARVPTHRRAEPSVRPKHGRPGCGAHARQSSRVLVPVTAPEGRLVQRLLGLLDDLDQPPPLGGRRGPGLHDLDAVPDTGDVLLVVRLELAGPADDLAVQPVLHAVLDLDDDGLLHLVADDEALADLAVPATGQARPGGFLGLAHATPSFGATERPSSRSRWIV